MEMLEVFNLLKQIIENRNSKREENIIKYVDDIFYKTQIILKNYFEMFSEIRINIISGNLGVDDVIEYLLKREYEIKDIRILVRSFLKDKYYQSNETLIRFVAAIYGIMECYPVENVVIIDKSKHTINSYIKFCQTLLLEDKSIQKSKIIHMTDCILRDLTFSWETVCNCYRELRR